MFCDAHRTQQHAKHVADDNQQLPTTDQRLDLGFIITKDLKWKKQTEKICKTANRVLGFITRNFRYKNKKVIILLYKSLVRPHLEYSVQFWSPNLRKDIDKIEKIQRRATKMISEIRNHSSNQRIQDLDLISLVQRRLRGQLIIKVFKYQNRFTTASARGLFDYDHNDRTRNNGVKLIVKHFNTSVAQHFYPIKITTTWNALPSEVVSSRTMNSFKNSFYKHWAENPEISELTGEIIDAFKFVQTVVSRRFAGSRPNGLSYYYCYYYYSEIYWYHINVIETNYYFIEHYAIPSTYICVIFHDNSLRIQQNDSNMYI